MSGFSLLWHDSEFDRTGGRVSESRQIPNAQAHRQGTQRADLVQQRQQQGGQSGRQAVSVLVLILREDGKTLILERASWPGFWQSVTGGVEWGEATQAAALRELAEETTLTPLHMIDRRVVRRFEIFPQYRHKYPSHIRFNEEHEFIARVPLSASVNIDPKEHVDYAWVSVDEAIARCLSWSNQMALRAYQWEFG